MARSPFGDSQIVDVGPADELGRRYAANRYIDASEKAILPGFVNTHHHFLQNLLKGDREDLDFPDWIDVVSAPRISMVVSDYLAGRYELQYTRTDWDAPRRCWAALPASSTWRWATHSDLIGVYEDAGIRGVHTLTLTDFDQWGHPGMLPADGAGFRLGGSVDRSLCRVSLWPGRFPAMAWPAPTHVRRG